MSVTPSSAIVGVFRDRIAAEQALDALYHAGITHEQVHYSVPEASNGFFDDLKSLFTGQNASGNVANDLADLGLSSEEANYYANEHSQGNIILAVKAPGRSAEVQTILQQYGSLNAQSNMNAPQDTAYYTNNTTSEPPITDVDTSAQTAQSNTQDTPPITHDNVPETHAEQSYASQEAQPVVTDGSLSQDALSPTSSQDELAAVSDAQPQSYTSDMQPATTDHTTDPHATSDAMIESETASDTTPEDHQAIPESYTAESEAVHIPDIQTAQPVATPTDYSTQSQLSDASALASDVPTEPLTHSTTTNEPATTDTTDQQPVTGTADTTTQQPAVGTTDSTDELQSLQAQIASLQQQLQDAKAQLQAAKERETQVRAAREREQQLQALRQQIQALQAELAATHSELQDTHSRLGQY